MVTLMKILKHCIKLAWRIENVKNKIFQMYVDLVDCCEDEEEMTPLEAKAAAAIALLRIVSEAIPDSGRRAALLATNSSGEIIGRVSI